MKRCIPNTLLLTLVVLFSQHGYAATGGVWQLNNDLSRLSFISTKATDIGEVHHFTRLQGTIGDAHTVAVEIDLASVETLIPIRNERMQQFLFAVAEYPTAEVRADVDADAWTGLPVGAVATLKQAATLRLKDRNVELDLQLLVARVGADRLVVSTLQPVLLNASAVGLGAGVEQLRAIAGLPNISQSVPVSFVLTFER